MSTRSVWRERADDRAETRERSASAEGGRSGRSKSSSGTCSSVNGRPDCESSSRRWPRRRRYSARRRETSRRHSGSTAMEGADVRAEGADSPKARADEEFDEATETSTALESSVSARGASQKEHVEASSSRRAPHCWHICITGPFCAAEVPVREPTEDSTAGKAKESEKRVL